jgi:hypothetical protein
MDNLIYVVPLPLLMKFQVHKLEEVWYGTRLGSEVMRFEADSEATAVRLWKAGRVVEDTTGLILMRRTNMGIHPVDTDPYRHY